MNPRFLVRHGNTVAYEKEDVELECKVYGRPEPTVHWLKNGELIIETEYFQVSVSNVPFSSYLLLLIGTLVPKVISACCTLNCSKSMTIPDRISQLFQLNVCSPVILVSCQYG